MSELEALYFSSDTLTITDFSKVYVGDEDVASKIDTIQITKPEGSENSKVLAYKNGNIVDIIPIGAKVIKVMLERGYIGFIDGVTYIIQIE